MVQCKTAIYVKLCILVYCLEIKAMDHRMGFTRVGRMMTWWLQVIGVRITAGNGYPGYLRGILTFRNGYLCSKNCTHNSSSRMINKIFWCLSIVKDSRYQYFHRWEFNITSRVMLANVMVSAQKWMLTNKRSERLYWWTPNTLWKKVTDAI